MNLAGIFTPYEPDAEFLISMITAMYAPASLAESDELVSNTDLLEQLRAMDPDLTPKHVYDAMIGMGFTAKPIDGAIYWSVMLM